MGNMLGNTLGTRGKKIKNPFPPSPSKRKK
jgi:hypothetical protein